MNFVNLKRIARSKVRCEQVQFDELEDFLKDWWSQKYTLPNNHPLLLEKTLEELLIEYYVDLFSKFPEELHKFECEIKEVKAESPVAEDEDWFQRNMGQDYTVNQAHSTKFNKELGQTKTDEVEFDDNYSSLGA